MDVGINHQSRLRCDTHKRTGALTRPLVLARGNSVTTEVRTAPTCVVFVSLCSTGEELSHGGSHWLGGAAQILSTLLQLKKRQRWKINQKIKTSGYEIYTLGFRQELQVDIILCVARLNSIQLLFSMYVLDGFISSWAQWVWRVSYRFSG